MNESEWNEDKGYVTLKKACLSTHDPNWVYILQKFADSLAELDNILHNLARNYSPIKHSKVINRISRQ